MECSNQLKISSGEFCEVRMETPCQDGLFGTPSIGICGPCMCAVGMHLSPVCNKTTGECYCNVSTTVSNTLFIDLSSKLASRSGECSGPYIGT